MAYCKCDKPDVDGSMEDGFFCTICEKEIEPVDYDPSDFMQDDEPINTVE